MTEEEFIKILRKKAKIKTHIEKNDDWLIKNADDYSKGIRDGKITYARTLLSKLK